VTEAEGMPSTAKMKTFSHNLLPADKLLYAVEKYGVSIVVG